MTTTSMWTKYAVTLQLTGRFAAGNPKTPKEIEGMVTHRAPTTPPPNATPLEEIITNLEEAVGASEDNETGWATFLHDDKGLYYEGRGVRGHIKDCVAQLQWMFPAIKNIKSKFINRVYVEDERIYLQMPNTQAWFASPTGTETRFIQVITRQGPRSAIKHIDYVECPTLHFTLLIMDDKLITEELLRAIFEYGAVHGMGQERSQGWGRYTLQSLIAS